ncbi:hypothetical protein RU639_001767 [Aspergillus parasiticus]
MPLCGDLAETHTRSFHLGESSGAEEIEELCGLAGVIPASRDPNKWNGAVTFRDQNSVAIVSYAKFRENGEVDSRAVLDRITTALDRACAAAGHMQALGHCCDSFTVIVHQNHEPEHGEGTTPVSLCRISFLSALQILAEPKDLSSSYEITESKLVNALTLLCGVLDPMFQNCPDFLHRNDLDGSLHSLSLMVQLMSLGFLSYNQAHVRPIQPFFLATTQRRILLAGSKACESPSMGIIAELTNLTCIGDMDERRFDLLATAEDLLDTWGPGGFIVYRHLSENPRAISISGGVIYAPRENASKFHWSPTANIEHILLAHLSPRSKICIGSLVAVNPNCNINEQECWERSMGPFQRETKTVGVCEACGCAYKI